jgi:hypothetical protein
MQLKKLVGLFSMAALSLTLVGAGLSATFTDSGAATLDVEVGSFNIDLTAPVGQGIVSCPPGIPGQNETTCSVTYDAGTLLSSAAGSKPFVFTVTSTGSIPALIHVSATVPDAPFTDVLGPVGDFTLTQGQSHEFNAGLQWSELGNLNLGTTASITYTISATA